MKYAIRQIKHVIPSNIYLNPIAYAFATVSAWYVTLSFVVNVVYFLCLFRLTKKPKNICFKYFDCNSTTVKQTCIYPCLVTDSAVFILRVLNVILFPCQLWRNLFPCQLWRNVIYETMCTSENNCVQNVKNLSSQSENFTYQHGILRSYFVLKSFLRLQLCTFLPICGVQLIFFLKKRPVK